MEKYVNEDSSKTPFINFDPDKGILEIKGRSIPENAIEFYKPLMEALDKYKASPQPTTEVTIELEYFNTSSSKSFLGFFKKLEDIHKTGSAVTVHWIYEKDDEDILEVGKDYQEIIDVPFKMVPIED